MVVRKGSCQGIANEVPPMDERCEVILPGSLKGQRHFVPVNYRNLF